jgi:cell division protein FtsA
VGASTGNTKSENPEISAGLDIGTTKVSLVIARRNGDMLDVIGLGTCPSNGLKKGMVINIDATVEAIKKAREEAELMAGVKIDTVWVGIAGNHIRSFNSRGMVAIKNQEVQKKDGGSPRV